MATKENTTADDAALIAGQFSCPHDLSERETACADGYCPLCDAPIKAALRRALAAMADEIAQLMRELDGTREARTWQRLRAERVERTLEQAHNIQNGMLRDLQAANAKLAEQAKEIAHGDKAVSLLTECRVKLERAEHNHPPREPTTEMMLAGLDVQDANNGQDTAGVWRAMYDVWAKVMLTSAKVIR